VDPVISSPDSVSSCASHRSCCTCSTSGSRPELCAHTETTYGFSVASLSERCTTTHCYVTDPWSNCSQARAAMTAGPSSTMAPRSNNVPLIQPAGASTDSCRLANRHRSELRLTHRFPGRARMRRAPPPRIAGTANATPERKTGLEASPNSGLASRAAEKGQSVPSRVTLRSP
jgi:hypothetical protein